MWFFSLFVAFVLIPFLIHLNKTYHVLAFFPKRIRTINGEDVERILPTLPGTTIFGNTFDTLGLDFVQTFKFFRHNAAIMKTSYVTYMGGKTLLNVIDADLAEMIMTNTKLITKGFFYKFIQPALGEGLLISAGEKWFGRRKMLTPAFHFNILMQFQEIFKEESLKFVKQLQNSEGEEIELDKHTQKFSLDVICETALGVKLDECLNGEQYRKNIYVFEESFNKRSQYPYLWNDFVYKTLEEYKYRPALKIVHDFSSDIIKKKRQIFTQEFQSGQTHEEQIYQKKRYAMLDTLLRAEQEGLIDHAGICEEVDTFMFEGFDTASMSLMFCLMNLSLYPEMQQRCYEEILEEIDPDLSTLDIAQLNKLKYLDCFFKESMRMYSTVPLVMRTAVEETQLPNGLILPANSSIMLHIFDLHRNPKYFAKPDVFNPDRFLPENSVGRHPYAFVPFSAGQRNCIGQKYTMLEMKTLVVFILKSFKILPAVNPETLQFKSGIIIRTKNDVKAKFIKRL
ncbi:probable cytochrome P450 4p3 [Stomoxys calcitrans]|uniref:probable cytochrome P450 4p3 n=1 Tax=Stomoxys calcitrans TaxID=35570 RepID=UPI0027E278F5|nr:probable cytochrome P450 4p3 [Stomoxys calcitrans]